MLKIAEQDQGERLDRVLARTFPEFSRVFLQKALRRGGVTLGGKARGPNYRVKAGEEFLIGSLDVIPAIRKPGSIDSPLTAAGNDDKGRAPPILFEDGSILVINKPAGLVVHPAPSHKGPTLLDWLRQHLGPALSAFPDPSRLGLVHRLDKDTSGVLVIAKTVVAQNALGRQFHDRQVKKTYSAFVEGVPPRKSGIISAPVGRSRKDPKRMAVTGTGRASETAYELREAFGEKASQLELFPKTGRTHQIRVHLAAIGHPIVGDPTYGANVEWSKSQAVERPLLHAEKLEIVHPMTHRPVTFKAPWPGDFRRARAAFRKAFGPALLAGVLGILPAISVRAEEGASSKRRHHASSSEYSRLKREVEDLKEQLSARIQTVEHAVADLNSRTIGTGNAAEDTKTQILDVGRKLKSQQELLEQMRDQLDRLQRDVVQIQARQDAK